jgi:hypothetical protein
MYRLIWIGLLPSQKYIMYIKNYIFEQKGGASVGRA